MALSALFASNDKSELLWPLFHDRYSDRMVPCNRFSYLAADATLATFKSALNDALKDCCNASLIPLLLMEGDQIVGTTWFSKYRSERWNTYTIVAATERHKGATHEESQMIECLRTGINYLLTEEIKIPQSMLDQVGQPEFLPTSLLFARVHPRHISALRAYTKEGFLPVSNTDSTDVLINYERTVGNA